MSDRMFLRGLGCGALLMLGADALHWLVSSSMHPDASFLRQILVALQLLVGLGGGVLLIRIAQREAPSRRAGGPGE